ncbi:CRAL/TRIO domain-containing protein [Armillaria fumosa]|nr:CRAL/TRIO domain-containing protein [Armillaria fumosa]
MSKPIYFPIPPPPTPSVAPHVSPLTEKQSIMYQTVYDHFAKPDYKIPGLEENAELMEEEKFWMSHECILRYLRASKWKTEAAIHRMEDTLKWRRSYGLYTTLTSEHVEPEASTGKQVIFGFTVDGKPGYYMFPSRQNTEESPRQIEFVVWILERCIDMMPSGVETVALFINFADKAKNPSLGTARQFLNILQNHYPERLGVALIINVPFLVNAFFKLVSPFIDPITREKMKFNPGVVKDGIVAADNVMKDHWGGDCEFVYEHEKYWPAIDVMCKERKKKFLEKWRQLGGTMGIKEIDYKVEIDLVNEKIPATQDTIAVVDNEVPVEVA